jgi:hypothetical protein
VKHLQHTNFFSFYNTPKFWLYTIMFLLPLLFFLSTAPTARIHTHTHHTPHTTHHTPHTTHHTHKHTHIHYLQSEGDRNSFYQAHRRLQCIYVYMYTYLAPVYILVYICIYIYIQIYHPCIYAYMYTYKFTTRVYMHIYIYIYIHTYLPPVYVHIHV